MTLSKYKRNLFYALILALTTAVISFACASTDNGGGSSSGGGSGGDSDMSCDQGDSREECADDIF